MKKETKDIMTNDEKIRLHATEAFIHLSELLTCHLPLLSKDSRQAIEIAVQVTDRLSEYDKPISKEDTDAG